jgi:hypothetical protein
MKPERSEHDGFFIYSLRLRFGTEVPAISGAGLAWEGSRLRFSKGRVAVLLSRLSLSSMNRRRQNAAPKKFSNAGQFFLGFGEPLAQERQLICEYLKKTRPLSRSESINSFRIMGISTILQFKIGRTGVFNAVRQIQRHVCLFAKTAQPEKPI